MKNVGSNPVDLIIAGRGNEKYADLTDLAFRLDLRTVGKRPLESLVKVGALDSFGPRCALLQSLDRVINVSAAHFRALESGQLSFFGGDTGVSETIHLPTVKEPDRKELLGWEKELIGLYVSAHPLTPYMPLLNKKTTHLIGQLGDLNQNDKVTIGGVVVKFRPHATKDGKPMGFATLEDIQGEIELVLFPRVWAKYSKLIKEEAVLTVEGKVDAAGASPKLLVDKIDLVNLEDAQSLPDAPVIPAKPETSEARKVTPPLTQHPENLAGLGEDVFGGCCRSFRHVFRRFMGSFHGRGSLYGMDEQPEMVHRAVPPVDTSPALDKSREIDVAIPVEHSAGFVLPSYQLAPDPILNPKAEDNDTSMVTVILRSTHDRTRDVRRMKSVQGLMQSSPGKDHFTFHIIEDGRRCLIEFPNNTTGITPELLNRLEKLVGKANFRVDPIILQ